MFRFKDLPILVQLKVVKYLKETEIFYLSLCNHHFSKIAKSINWGVDVPPILRLPESIGYSFYFKEHPPMFDWVPTSALKPSEKKIKHSTITVFLNNQYIKLRMFYNDSNRTFKYIFPDKDVEWLLFEFVNLGSHIFNGPSHISLILCGTPITLVSKLKSLRLCAIAFNGERNPSEYVEKVLELLYQDHPLVWIEHSIKGNFKRRSEWFKVENVFVQNSSHMFIYQIFEFNGRFGKFYDSRFLTRHVIQLIRKWMNGEFNNLEWFIITSSVEEFNKDTILEEVPELQEWNSDRRPKHFVPQDENTPLARFFGDDEYFDCSYGWDIERPSDGMLATVRMAENIFELLVWKHLTEVKELST